MICKKRICHSRHRHYGKKNSRRASNVITKVEQPYGQPAEQDGEVEP